MTTQLLLPVLAQDLESLSQTIAKLAMDMKNVHPEVDAENAEALVQEKASEVSAENSSSKTSVEDPKTVVSVDHSGGESSTSSDPVVTIEQVRAVLAEKSQAGFTGEVRKLLSSYGADKLSAVSPDRYAELIVAAKDLG